MRSALEISLILVGTIHLASTRFALMSLHQPTSLLLWFIKVVVSAVSPVLFLVGLLLAIAGMIIHSTVVFVMGAIGALLYLIHIYAITRGPDEPSGFEQAFGKNWFDHIAPAVKAGFLPARYALHLPKITEPSMQQDLVYYTVPNAGRPVLCDIWQPAAGSEKSGLAFIYLHGSAWTALDKDFGTRKFFRHLAAQGHLVMDIAYRLFPETDMQGMVQDAFHAIAWMKHHAAEYGIDPNRIVIGGGSAGAHIALLVAYGNDHSQLKPSELEGIDLKVRGVISLYGQANLATTYYHTCQHLVGPAAQGKDKQVKPPEMPGWLLKRMGDSIHRLGFDKKVDPGQLAPILGGSPEEKPALYNLYSPLNHAGKNAPATLIILGQQDILAPVDAMLQLSDKLKALDTTVVTHLIPQTDHAFDLIFPGISPSAQNAWYDVERFLGLL